MKARSIFWPLVMIATGVVWLLVGMEYIPRANLWALIHILPLLLIALGFGLILRAYWEYAGMLVSLLVVGGAVIAVLYAPQYNWDSAPGWGIQVWDINSRLGGGVPGSGVLEVETRQLSEFDALVIEYPADFTVKQGRAESISIEAEDNLLPQLATRIQNGTLYFENKELNWSRRVNPTKPIEVTITVVELSEVRFPSAGKMEINNIESDSLDVSISGAGDIIFSELNVDNLEFGLSGAGNVFADGSAENLNLRISGLGNFNGSDLQTQEATVHISGAGSASIWVESELEARISGAGSIDYYGDPEVSKHISGVGSIHQSGDK